MGNAKASPKRTKFIEAIMGQKKEVNSNAKIGDLVIW